MLAPSDHQTRLCDSVRRRPPKFRGIHFTSVKAVDAPVLRAEIAVLLAKDAIEPVPPADMRTGFYSPYFIVPKKGGGLRPILDLRVLNRALHKLPFKMLTQKRIFGCIRPQDWFAAIDLKDAYFHVSTSAPQAIPAVCVRRTGISVQGPALRAVPVAPCLHESCGGSPCSHERTGCSHSQLPRRLAHTGSVSGPVVRTQGLGAFTPQPVGPSGQLGKEQTLPDAEDLFSRYGVGFGQSDSTPHAGTCSVGVELLEYVQEQDSGPTETISEAPGAYGSYGGSYAVGAASYETASTLASWPNPEVGVATRHSPGPSHTGLPPNPHPVVRPFVPSGRSAPGTGLQACCGYTDASTTGWGATFNGLAVSGVWTGPQLHWHINCLELLAVRLALIRLKSRLRGEHVLVRTDNTATVAYINRQGGLRSRRMSQLARHLLLWSQKHLRSLRAIHIPGLLNRAADELSRAALPGEWRLHPQTVQLMWRRFGPAQVDLFASLETSHCQLFFSLTEGTLGTDALAHSWPRGLRKYAFPPVSLLAQTLCKIREDEEQVLLVAPYWPTRTWFPELMLLVTAPPWQIPLRKDLLTQRRGTLWHRVQTSANFMSGPWTGRGGSR